MVMFQVKIYLITNQIKIQIIKMKIIIKIKQMFYLEMTKRGIWKLILINHKNKIIKISKINNNPINKLKNNQIKTHNQN